MDLDHVCVLESRLVSMDGATQVQYHKGGDGDPPRRFVCFFVEKRRKQVQQSDKDVNN